MPFLGCEARRLVAALRPGACRFVILLILLSSLLVVVAVVVAVVVVVVFVLLLSLLSLLLPKGANAGGSETGRWLLTGERIVRDIFRMSIEMAAATTGYGKKGGAKCNPGRKTFYNKQTVKQFGRAA